MTDCILKLKESIECHCADTDGIVLRENEKLSGHSTFKIGGPAKLYAIPKSVHELKWLIGEIKVLNVRMFVLGHGSNLLFDDDGFDGIVVSTEALNKISIEGNTVIAESGAMLTLCAASARDAGLSGMECLYGIPGSIGGAVYMNAGAYGGEMSDIVVETTYLDIDTLEVKTIACEEHGFGYRKSVFCKSNSIILETVMKLKADDIQNINNKMNEYKRLRIEKQPLEYPSAGSTFKRYPGRYTAQMIDEAGLKGYTVGGAQVSEKHAGFVINKGGATCKDVLELISVIKNKIKKLHDIEIETEVIYVK